MEFSEENVQAMIAEEVTRQLDARLKDVVAELASSLRLGSAIRFEPMRPHPTDSRGVPHEIVLREREGEKPC